MALTRKLRNHTHTHTQCTQTVIAHITHEPIHAVELVHTYTTGKG